MGIKYPDVLTDKAWQKKKGVAAKTKSSGVGKTLIALEKAYATTEFAKSDPGTFAKETTDPSSYAKRRASMIAAMTQQGAKLGQLADASIKAVAGARTTFAKDKALTAYLGDMHTALGKFKSDFAAKGHHMTQFMTQADREFKYALGQTRTGKFVAGGAAARTEKSRQQVLADIRKLEAAKQIALVHTLWGADGAHRVLTTGCELWDNFYRKDCPGLARSIYGGDSKQEFGHLPWVWEVANEMNSDATKKLTEQANASSEDRAVTSMTLAYSRSMIEFKRFTDIMEAFEVEVRKWL